MSGPIVSRASWNGRRIGPRLIRPWTQVCAVSHSLELTRHLVFIAAGVAVGKGEQLDGITEPLLEDLFRRADFDLLIDDREFREGPVRDTVGLDRDPFPVEQLSQRHIASSGSASSKVLNPPTN